jgi:signal transduction histidine kinase
MAHFQVAARTILHLGAELISSDAIALYELVKNAHDARSKKGIIIDIVERIPFAKSKQFEEIIQDEIANKTARQVNKSIQNIAHQIIDAIDKSTPFSKELIEAAEKTNSANELLKLIESANYIRIEDFGRGMSESDLKEVYLTIGTRSRYKERERQKRQRDLEETVEESIEPILGEKGVGRLSAMRLGQQLKVQTKKVGEKNWNYLSIDWSQFSHESDDLLEDVDAVKLWQDKNQDEVSRSGTVITISGLNSVWPPDKLRDIARKEFSKITDPFADESKYSIVLNYNNSTIKIPSFDKVLSKIAHAYVEAKLIFKDGKPILKGKVDYLLHKESKSFTYREVDLLSICNLGERPKVLKSLGPFQMMFYWFNRGLIRGIDGLGTKQDFRDLIAHWSGGLMVFRDGFRIYPYGGENDDWLDLDKKAFGAKGFKLNRRQVIGKVDLTAYANPALRDQTNREGLIDNEESEAFKTILKTILFQEFKLFTDFVDKEKKIIEKVSFKVVEERLEDQEEKILENLDLLVKEFKIPRNTPEIVNLQKAIEDIKGLMNNAKELAEIHEDDKSKYLHLAALGLMAEVLAHELSRTSANVITTLKEIDHENLPTYLDSQLGTLASQMQTLQKRLKILDPLSTRGRQVKESFDLVAWVEENMSAHKPQFMRHNIKYSFAVKPNQKSKFVIKAVKGMIVQILENLIDNSIYWVKDYKKYDKRFLPEISITIDSKSGKLFFSDNGPGIAPERNEEVFLPFFSTKPFKIGKGLGLYISREIAEYNGARLYLSDSKNRMGNLNVFVLELESASK